MSAPLQARPTTYNGIDMRSRLEAKVAQWLDWTGAKWDYETRAYASNGGQYLPDFRVHEIYIRGLEAESYVQDYVFVEVRPTVDRITEVWKHESQILWRSARRPLLYIGFEEAVPTWGGLADPDHPDFLIRAVLGKVEVDGTWIPTLYVGDYCGAFALGYRLALEAK